MTLRVQLLLQKL